MGKINVGDYVLRSGNFKTLWKYRVIAVRGRWWWRKCMIESVEKDMYFEENAHSLYLYPPKPLKKGSTDGDSK